MKKPALYSNNQGSRIAISDQCPDANVHVRVHYINGKIEPVPVDPMFDMENGAEVSYYNISEIDHITASGPFEKIVYEGNNINVTYNGNSSFTATVKDRTLDARLIVSAKGGYG